MKEIKAILIGAGDRGEMYGTYAFEENSGMKLVAVAEPVEARRLRVQKAHNLPDDMVFESWEDVLKAGKLADLAIIATQDKMHFEPTMQAIELGYDILLEKPISPSLDECLKMAKAADEKGVLFTTCYVLRYTQMFKKMKEYIDAGKIGNLVNLQHIEGVGFWHMAHAFVRGHWQNSDESAPIILAKCCHDMDIMNFLVGSNPAKVQSFGSLNFFNEKNAPEGSTDYCINGCAVRETCPYDSVRLYLKDGKREEAIWPCETVSPDDTSIAGRTNALKTTKWGKCVFKSDNNVMDNQIVNVQYENGVNASFTMSAFTKDIGRNIRALGTHGELVGVVGEQGMKLTYYDFTKFDFITEVNWDRLPADVLMDVDLKDLHGHGGGDFAMMAEFLQAIRDKDTKPYVSAADTVMSHVLAFAAEKSRIEGRVVDITNEYKK